MKNSQISGSLVLIRRSNARSNSSSKPVLPLDPVVVPHRRQRHPINRSALSTSALIKSWGRPPPGNVSSQPSSSILQLLSREKNLIDAFNDFPESLPFFVEVTRRSDENTKNCYLFLHRNSWRRENSLTRKLDSRRTNPRCVEIPNSRFRLADSKRVASGTVMADLRRPRALIPCARWKRPIGRH